MSTHEAIIHGIAAHLNKQPWFRLRYKTTIEGKNDHAALRNIPAPRLRITHKNEIDAEQEEKGLTRITPYSNHLLVLNNPTLLTLINNSATSAADSLRSTSIQPKQIPYEDPNFLELLVARVKKSLDSTHSAIH